MRPNAQEVLRDIAVEIPLLLWLGLALFVAGVIVAIAGHRRPRSPRRVTQESAAMPRSNAVTPAPRLDPAPSQHVDPVTTPAPRVDPEAVRRPDPDPCDKRPSAFLQ